MKTFNKRGDGGETSLLFGARVAKSDPRCEAYGTIDEAVSILGLARHFCGPEIKDIVFTLQKELFTVGAELATPGEHYARLAERGKTVTRDMVERLENLIEQFEAKLKMPETFIIPGSGSTGSAVLDIGRTVIRRAERRVVALKEDGLIKNAELLKYLNRLADLIFTLARYEDSKM